jgi:hypothetical protein
MVKAMETKVKWNNHDDPFNFPGINTFKQIKNKLTR